MSHVLTKRYLYGFNGIGTRFCSSFKSVSIVSRTHRVDFDICSDIDRFYKANSYSTYYSLNLCQLKCTWSPSKPLKHHNKGPISDENLSFQQSISLYSRIVSSNLWSLLHIALYTHICDSLSTTWVNTVKPYKQLVQKKVSVTERSQLKISVNTQVTLESKPLLIT